MGERTKRKKTERCDCFRINKNGFRLVFIGIRTAKNVSGKRGALALRVQGCQNEHHFYVSRVYLTIVFLAASCKFFFFFQTSYGGPTCKTCFSFGLGRGAIFKNHFIFFFCIRCLSWTLQLDRSFFLFVLFYISFDIPEAKWRLQSRPTRMVITFIFVFSCNHLTCAIFDRWPCRPPLPF